MTSTLDVAGCPVLRRRVARTGVALAAAPGAVLLAVAVLTAGPARAGTSLGETWVADTIRQETAGQADTDRPRRRSAVERMVESDRDADDLRPQRRAQRRLASTPRPAQRGTRLASLGREIAPPPRQPAIAPPPRPLIERPQQEARPNPAGPVVASLGRDFIAPAPSTLPSLSGGAINWVASAECLAGKLRDVLAQVASNFGPLRVNSTCRSKRHNARVGGARRSYHLTGSAADFRVAGKIKEVYAFLRGNRAVGGLKHYGFGLFHIDTGPRRTW